MVPVPTIAMRCIGFGEVMVTTPLLLLAVSARASRVHIFQRTPARLRMRPGCRAGCVRPRSTLITSAPKSDSIVAAAGAAMKLAISTTFKPENTDCGVCVVMISTSHERAQAAGHRAPDDQRLHLPGALVGVERFGVGD